MPQELRLRGITTMEEANKFLREHYVAEFNLRFQVAAAQPDSAFLPCPRKDLGLVFALQFERSVNRDNTVSFQNLKLQIKRVSWRGTLAGCSVVLHQHLEGTLTITYGPHRVGHFDSCGVPITDHPCGKQAAVEKTRAAKAMKPAFPARLEIPRTPRDSHFPPAAATAGLT